MNSSFLFRNIDLLSPLNHKIINSEADFILVSGESGTGKSTLLKMIRKQNESTTRYFSSKNHIFSGSLSENIWAGRSGGVNLSDVLQILFPNERYLQFPESTVSEKNISDGQIQRICIARDVICSGDKIVLLDEPTSALDPNTEGSVVKMLVDFQKDFKVKKYVIATHSGRMGRLLSDSKSKLLELSLRGVRLRD